MNKIYVVGLGPGHRDYILPIAKKIVLESDVIIGAKRNLNNIDTKGKEIFDISLGLKEMIVYIKNNWDIRKIVVVVSGDTGFYSLSDYLKRNLDNRRIKMIPGISSLQYMFSKVGESWEDAYLCSLHGRNNDFLTAVKENKKVGILTDKVWNPQKIASELIKNNMKSKIMYVGENLSYETEKIYIGKPEEIVCLEEIDLNVVVILDEIM
ncbi:precorrin-6y C5,15-methyltransferase (decarboxylating) subunit CbiE [Clostridium sp. D2Q-11]|uniref:Precorrin-6y C5,15-methyltransferase (Decarboxylating) subunit CbiE n=1 Tax=Anaeromonas frigoriresistens TaxID=2683708 RepID=A0A942UX66_9FIRM|nr:precorrin-6y C5,15-methyltransferase (decarboxylating) subunit CbiE [Anaeromonas frigoriresistens]MBS4538571.1 precorrin-6y C5,15-methyltransferase (decarboxylating) subunit CbiE [Anaeromonas frigoriresistens]